jgi:hypothetical protein
MDMIMPKCQKLVYADSGEEAPKGSVNGVEPITKRKIVYFDSWRKSQKLVYADNGEQAPQGAAKGREPHTKRKIITYKAWYLRQKLVYADNGEDAPQGAVKGREPHTKRKIITYSAWYQRQKLFNAKFAERAPESSVKDFKPITSRKIVNYLLWDWSQNGVNVDVKKDQSAPAISGKKRHSTCTVPNIAKMASKVKRSRTQEHESSSGSYMTSVRNPLTNTSRYFPTLSLIGSESDNESVRSTGGSSIYSMKPYLASDTVLEPASSYSTALAFAGTEIPYLVEQEADYFGFFSL